MKIGLVCPYDLFSPGGVKEHVLSFYRELKKVGHQVKIIGPATRKTAPKDFLLLGRSMPIPSTTGSWGRLSLCFENQDVQKILRREKFDLIHFHEPLVPFLSWQILFASRAINVATFCSAWDNDTSLMSNIEGLMKPFSEVFEEKFSGLIAISQTAKNCWQKFFQKQIKVIPTGIDLERFHRQIEPIKKYQNAKTNILFIGRLESRKGGIYLLRAWEKMDNQNRRLIMVGSGPRKMEVEFYAAARQLVNVEFVGRVNEEALPRYLASADICCFPSIGSESFGIVLLEAMAMGKAIVCFRNPGYQEVLKNYPFTKGLVKVKNVKGLAEALIILSEDEKLRHQLGQWGQRQAQKYSWPKISQQILEFYQRLGQNKD